MFDGLFEGLAWVLAFFYDLTHSYGLAIILLTITVMAVVTPLTLKGTKSMMAMQRLQPEMRRIQQEFKHDRQQLNEEMLRFYKENDINPMGSCLPLLIQMPIFLVLFRVVKGLTSLGADKTFDPKYLAQTSSLYQSLKGQTQMLFLGIDLEKTPLNVLKLEGFVPALPFMVLIADVEEGSRTKGMSSVPKKDARTSAAAGSRRAASSTHARPRTRIWSMKTGSRSTIVTPRSAKVAIAAFA